MKTLHRRRLLVAVLFLIIIGGALAGRWLAHRPGFAKIDTDLLSRPRVAADIVTYQPLLDELDLLLGEAGADFTTLTSGQWAILEKESPNGRSTP